MSLALEELGIAGKKQLHEALTNTKDPLQAIEDFQQDNSILIPTLRPALQLLDLHNKKRLDFHESVFVVLQNHLISQITEISKSSEADSKDKLLAILEKSFSLIKIEALAPVSICLLKNLKKVPEKYLNILTNDKELYNICPIEVKRQIWQKNQTLFGDEVLPLLTLYIKEKENMFLEQGSSVFGVSPKVRRQCKALKTLTEVIGKNIRLYDMVLQFLRTFYLKTRMIHYCSLRNEILMCLHDDEVTDVCSVDPCYKFTWCLNACIRENFVESKRARELQVFLDTIKKSSEKVLGDLSMILCDPFAMNTMLSSVLKTMHDVTQKEMLPRENQDFLLLIRMLALGQSAWEIIDKQVFKEPKVDKDILQNFLPSLISHNLIDQTNILKNRCKALKEPTDATPVPPVVEETPPPKKKARKGSAAAKATTAKENAEKSAHTRVLETISHYYCTDNLCRNILIWYTLHLIKTKKKSQLTDVLHIIAKSPKEVANNFLFVSMLTYSISTNSDLLNDDEIFNVIFYKIFISNKTVKELQQKAILRCLIAVCNKNLYEKLKPLTEKLEPKKKACEAVQELYRTLREKVANLEHQQKAAAAPTTTGETKPTTTTTTKSAAAPNAKN